MQKPARILFLLEDLCFGGTQLQSLELASRLDRALFEPILLTLTGPTDLDAKAKAAGLPVINMGRSRKAAPLFFARLGAQIRRIMPDILVPCTALPNIWGRIWGRVQKTPVVVGTVRGGGAPRRQHERLLWRLCDGIVCNSRELAKTMRDLGAPDERLFFIPNGVDVERFKPAPKKSPSESALIVCVARLAGDKDHMTLLRAFSQAAAHFPRIRLRLVGEGPREAALRSFVANQLPEEVAARVEFAGASQDPATHYAEADLFALSSIREGAPNAVLEAMACGLPICATSVGAIPELLDGNGLVSWPGDVDGMASNLLACLRAPAMALHLGAAGRVKAEREYSYKAMVQRHQDLFLPLLNSARNKQ